MPRTYTFTYTVEPTPQDVTWGVLQHSYLLAALVFLWGLLFASRVMEEDPP